MLVLHTVENAQCTCSWCASASGANFPGLSRGGGWGMSAFPSHPAQLHSWEQLRGVVLPGDRGVGVSHRETFRVPGKVPVCEPPRSFPLQALRPHPTVSKS